MLAGDDYQAGDPELVALRSRALLLVHAYNSTRPDEPDERRRLLVELLGSAGPGIELEPPFRCDYGGQIEIGARSFANFNLIALDVARISIGEDVQMGPNVQLLTAGHPLDADRRRAKWEWGKPIVIGDNVWLGGGVIVCPNVTIGAHTVVGAGSVVTKDLPPNVLAVGCPARVIRTL